MGRPEELYAYHFNAASQPEQVEAEATPESEIEAAIDAATWQSTILAKGGLERAAAEAKKRGGLPIDVAGMRQFLRDKHAEELRKRIK